MRLTVTYDVHGNITGLIASPPESEVGYLAAKPGERMTEIEVPPDLRHSLGSERIHERLADLRQNYRVDLESTKSRLTKKT